VPEGFGLKFFALCVLIVCSAILTGAEAAYFSLGRARLKHVAPKDEDEPVGEPKPLIERPHELLVTLLVGITVINIGAAALAATIADSIFGPTVGLFVEIIVLVFVLTTFGEVLPMTLAVKYPERFLAIAGPPVAWLGVLLAPARATLTGLTALMVRIVSRGRTEQATLSEEELRTLVDVGASEGVVEREEREMIHKVFELEDTLVRSVMVPRTDMVCLDVETPTAEILPALREHLHSRVPVYEGAIDVIVGILYAKDLLPFMEGLPPDFDLRSHLHPPYFVPESKRADALLQEFHAKRVQMAIVVDEYGGTAGLVTVEDLLEEIVGEIRDEYDVESETVSDEGNGTFVFSGKVSVDEVRDRLGIEIEREGFETVGGYLLAHLGRMPYVGERFDVDGLSVEVLEVERRRITKVRVRLRQANEETAS
jgi:putative hemolysin